MSFDDLFSGSTCLHAAFGVCGYLREGFGQENGEV